jgi:Tol biopolymer transport system component
MRSRIVLSLSQFPAILLTALATLSYGCSINASRSPSVRTTAAAAPSGSSPSSQQIGNPSLPSTSIPITWSALNLRGRIIFQNSVQSVASLHMSIQSLDLSTGKITTIFDAPPHSWIDFMSVAPDGRQLVMSYFPAPPANAPSTLGQQNLFILPSDGSNQPKALMPTLQGAGDQYRQPAWSPDGKYIYYSHVDFNAPARVSGQNFSFYEIYRMAYPGGVAEKLADAAYWPRLSLDGSLLVYVTLDPVDGTNKLFVANPDGSGAHPVNISGGYVPSTIEAPLISVDNKSILFSAEDPMPTIEPNWLDRLFGPTRASAHAAPSDWWSVPVSGGSPIRLTYLAADALYGSFSPDGKYIASYSDGGIFVMNPDGTGLTTLVNDVGDEDGSVNWLP